MRMKDFDEAVALTAAAAAAVAETMPKLDQF